jgi:site-specific DNA-methyltransferase (adenine-specific)
MNPPYGEINAWVRKAYESSIRGAVIVCLLPSRTDQAWWHDIVMRHASEIRFIRGRLRFGGKLNAPFPNVIVVFGKIATNAFSGSAINFTTMSNSGF